MPTTTACSCSRARTLAFEKLLEYRPPTAGRCSAPDGLAEDFRGWLYVSDTGNHRVVVFDNSGKFLFHFGADGGLTVEFSIRQARAGWRSTAPRATCTSAIPATTASPCSKRRT